MRIVLLFAFLSAVGGAAESPGPERDVRAALEQTLAALRNAPDTEAGALLTKRLSADAPSDARKALRSLRDALRPTDDRPMSELGPPIVRTWAVSTDASGPVRLCAAVVRLGSVLTVRLAVARLTMVRSGERWLVSGVADHAPCASSPEAGVTLAGIDPTRLP